jgi:U2-associated protein SR140
MDVTSVWERWMVFNVSNVEGWNGVFLGKVETREREEETEERAQETVVPVKKGKWKSVLETSGKEGVGGEVVRRGDFEGTTDGDVFGEEDGRPFSLQEEDLDGQPMEDDDLDGMPMELEDFDGIPIEHEDVDGEPMEDDDVDGQPIQDERIAAPMQETDITASFPHHEHGDVRSAEQPPLHSSASAVAEAPQEPPPVEPARSFKRQRMKAADMFD